MSELTYYKSIEEIKIGSNDRLLNINPGVSKKDELLHIFSNGLSFPKYFGNNWDALYDCLSDLAWIKEKVIIIIHKDIPLENVKIESKKYIELLADVQAGWQNNQVHELRVLFPHDCKREIEAMLDVTRG
jgi:RNAse (barnase) inhibitor barstar